VVKLRTRQRDCECGESWGYYHPDGEHATIGGAAVALGFSNLSFPLALSVQPEDGEQGERFEAFIIPKKCKTVTVLPTYVTIKEMTEHRLQLLLLTLKDFPVGRLDCRSEANVRWLAHNFYKWTDNPYSEEIHARAKGLLHWYNQERRF
jgi:hypothetical protein